MPCNSVDAPSRATQPVALWGIGIYGQDEWRVSRSLKLTLALRGEHNSNPVCQLDCAALLDAPFNTLLAAGQRYSHHTLRLDHRRQSSPGLPFDRCDQHFATVRICLVAGRHGSNRSAWRIRHIL